MDRHEINILRDIAQELQINSDRLSAMILRTPTGPQRDKLTEININMMMAQGVATSLVNEWYRYATNKRATIYVLKYFMKPLDTIQITR